MIGPGSGNGRSCKWSQKPSKYINSGDEFYCVSTNIEEIFLELNDNVSFQQKIWTSSSCGSMISIQVHVLSRLSCILFAAAAELLDIVAFAKWAGYVCGKPPALFVSSGPIFEPVHRGQIFDMSLPVPCRIFALYCASVWSGSILTEKTGCLP